MDARLLNNVVRELGGVSGGEAGYDNRCLIRGGLITKVHEPDERTLIIRIFIHGGERRLIISTDPVNPRMHLSGERPKNPQTPKRFCALLRSRISGGRITGIRTLEGERIAIIGISTGKGEDTREYTLTVELTGKSSNIILTDENKVIIDAIRYFEGSGKVRVAREVVPGEVLEPLPPPPTPHIPHMQGKGEDERLEGESWNDFAERTCGGAAGERTTERLKRELRGVIKSNRKRIERKLRKLREEREKGERNIHLTETGELLKANFHLIKKGEREVTVIDYSKAPPSEVTVPIEPSYTPQKNLEDIFKKAKKARKALEMLETRIPEEEEELAYTDTLLYECDEIRDESDYEKLKELLYEINYIKNRVQRAKDKERMRRKRRDGGGQGGPPGPTQKKGQEEYRLYHTDERNLEIRVGRSGKGNDALVKGSSQRDLWFHIEGMAGSHVILRLQKGDEAAKDEIIEAAELAAYYSKGRDGGKVPVIYTEIKNVRKPRGAHPGSVTVSKHSTVLVRPRDKGEKGSEGQ